MTPTCSKCETPMQLVKREIHQASMGCFGFYDVVKVYHCFNCGEIVERRN